MKIIRSILLLTTILFATSSTNAQEHDSQKSSDKHFYIGTHAAAAIAESNFCAFGADKFYPGWNAGLNAGYQLTRIWSLELSSSWSRVSLAEQDCCLSRNYILGSDLNRYYDRSILPEGMIGQYYNNIRSNVFVQRYGLQINFNILGLFNRTKGGPWELNLSPSIYAAGTHASILTKDTKTPIAKNITTWHLGYGGQLFASYAVADNMHVGFYGAYTQYVGRPIDGLPRVHSTNYTVDAGVKFIVTFNKKRNSTIISDTDVTSLIPEAALADLANQQELSFQEDTHEKVLPQISDSSLVSAEKTAIGQEDTDSTISIQEKTKEDETETVGEKVAEKIQNNPTSTGQEEILSLKTPFPIIYFSFNSVWIEPEQRIKVDEIVKALKADHSVRIRIVGWGDEVGGQNVNKRVSLQRAEAVKKKLVRNLIDTNRIEVVGGGIAPNATTPEKGRIAIVQIIP